MPEISRFKPFDEVEPIKCPKDGSFMKYHPTAGAWKCTRPGCRMKARSDDAPSPNEQVQDEKDWLVEAAHSAYGPQSPALEVMDSELSLYAIVRRKDNAEDSRRAFSLHQYVTDCYANGESGNYADVVITIEIPAYLVAGNVE